MPYLKGGVEVLIEGVSVLVMAIYLARHPDVYADGVVALVPPPRRPLARAILQDLNLTIRAWVIGQIIAMVLLAALTTLGLWALGMPYFLAFGVFAGVAAIVPFFGVLLSTRGARAVRPRRLRRHQGAAGRPRSAWWSTSSRPTSWRRS